MTKVKAQTAPNLTGAHPMKYLIAAAVAFCFAGVSFADEMPEKATPDSVQKTQKQRTKHKKTKTPAASAAASN
ncbi:hypothetical protein JCM19000A_04360 [Silvimonas sp. JCM 19000]